MFYYYYSFISVGFLPPYIYVETPPECIVFSLNAFRTLTTAFLLSPAVFIFCCTYDPPSGA